MTIDIKEMIVGDKKVKFLYFKDNALWYITETNFEFPVPIEDASGATFNTEDKAIYFLRWIKGHAKNLDVAATEQLGRTS